MTGRLLREATGRRWATALAYGAGADLPAGTAGSCASTTGRGSALHDPRRLGPGVAGAGRRSGLGPDVLTLTGGQLAAARWPVGGRR